MLPKERHFDSDDPWQDEQDIRSRRRSASLREDARADRQVTGPKPRSRQSNLPDRQQDRLVDDFNNEVDPYWQNDDEEDEGRKGPSERRAKGNPKKQGFFSRPPKKSDAEKGDNANEKSPGRWSGGRIGVLLLKVVIWGLLVIFLINGIRGVFNPPRINTTVVAESVANRLGIVKFPLTTAEPLAELFARVYLNNPAGKELQREENLERFLPKNQFALNATAFPLQELIAGPYLVGEPVLIDDNRAIYTFRAQISRAVEAESAPSESVARWIFLSVPVFADETGAVRISGLPAFVPGPRTSDESTKLGYQGAPAETEDIVASDLNTFFAAWGAGDTAVLERYVAPAADNVETSPTVTAGLGAPGGTPLVEFVEIAEISVEAFTPNTTEPIRTQVKVIWNDGGQRIEQSYLLTLRYNDGRAWYVQDIQGGSFLG